MLHSDSAATTESPREAEARELLAEAWQAICFTRQPDDEKAVAENRLLARIEGWLRA